MDFTYGHEERSMDSNGLFEWDSAESEFCVPKSLKSVNPLHAVRRSSWEIWPRQPLPRRTEVSTGSTGRRTKTDFPPKSRFFMVRVGQEPRGVIGYGTIPTGELLPPDSHWDPRKEQEDIPYVNIHFESLIDSEEHPEMAIMPIKLTNRN
jgi:hypothetical protein